MSNIIFAETSSRTIRRNNIIKTSPNSNACIHNQAAYPIGQTFHVATIYIISRRLNALHYTTLNPPQGFQLLIIIHSVMNITQLRK